MDAPLETPQKAVLEDESTGCLVNPKYQPMRIAPSGIVDIRRQNAFVDCTAPDLIKDFRQTQILAAPWHAEVHRRDVRTEEEPGPDLVLDKGYEGHIVLIALRLWVTLPGRRRDPEKKLIQRSLSVAGGP
ncbi:MAG: hypothetical protein WBC59_10235 [Phycisphaerae bacterium]